NDSLLYFAMQGNIGELIKDLNPANLAPEGLAFFENFKGEMAFFLNYVPQSGGKADSYFADILQPVIAVELNRDAFVEANFNTALENLSKVTGQEYVDGLAGDVPIHYQRGLGA